MDLDLDLGTDLMAHRTPREEHNGVPDGSTYWPAMPYEMRSPGPRRTLPGTLWRCAPLGSWGAPSSTPRPHLPPTVAPAPGTVGPRLAGPARHPLAAWGHASRVLPSVPCARCGHSRSPGRTGRPWALPLTKARPGPRPRCTLPKHPTGVAIPPRCARPGRGRHHRRALRCTIPVSPASPPHPFATAHCWSPHPHGCYPRWPCHGLRPHRWPPHPWLLYPPPAVPPWRVAAGLRAPMCPYGSSPCMARACVCSLLPCMGTGRRVFPFGESSCVHPMSGGLAFCVSPSRHSRRLVVPTGA